MADRSVAFLRVPRRKPVPNPPQDDRPAQHDMRCDACGNQCTFDPEKEALVCSSCDAHHPFETGDERQAMQEYPFDPNAANAEPHGLPPEQEHRCGACGGTILFSGATLSERCPYCDGAMVLTPASAGYDAMALIPFRVSAETARNRALEWVGSRVAAPVGLKEHVAQTARTAGLYVPFWTFDTSEKLTVTTAWLESENKRLETRTESHHHDVALDDLLAPASPHVTSLIRDGILHDFDPAALKPFDPRYLAGFAAERHHQSVIEGFHANRPDKQVQTKRRIRKERLIGDSTTLAYRTDAITARYRRILLPVWISHYARKGQPRKIVVSGIDGRTFGERPLSLAKLIFASASVSLAVVLAGILMGMALA